MQSALSDIVGRLRAAGRVSADDVLPMRGLDWWLMRRLAEAPLSAAGMRRSRA